HRFPLRARQVESFARALAAEVTRLLRAGAGGNEERLNALEKLADAGPRHSESLEPAARRWATAVARDLTAKDRAGKTLILAGDFQPPVVQALAHVINLAL